MVGESTMGGASPQFNTQALMAQLCGVAFSRAVMVVLDRMLLPEPKVTALRDEMVRVIDENKDKVKRSPVELKTLSADQTASEFSAAFSQVSSSRQDAVLEYIRHSLEDLEKARDATNCKVCKREIDNAANEVRKRMAAIQQSDLIYRKVRELEEAGELPPDSKWSTLSEVEKERVKSMIRAEMSGNE